MPENQSASSLGDIQHSLDLAVSQVAIYNLYVDEQSDDSHLSNCLISLKLSLQDISTRLHQYQQSQAIAPSVDEEVISNGN